jgi:para-nitrobenzyl esterase
MKVVRTWSLSVCLVALVCSPALAQIQTHSPIALDAGKVSGAIIGSQHDISVYKGIPYVAPPIGALRWRAPQPVKPWDGVREAIAFGPIQPQVRRGAAPAANAPRQNEDSLYLNVWTPAKNATDKLPVMVWIHGGGFTYGSGSAGIYDGTRLAEHGVVLVSFNYRLNVLAGFAHPSLTTETGGGSGNYGTLDQIAALQWVRRNIAAFGGDPGNVTIFGESAGGISVSVLMVSPLAKGLFHRAIVESGSTAEIATLASAEKAGEELVSKMGLASDPHLLDTLRSKSWGEIPGAANYRGAPIVDGKAILDQPGTLCAAGKQHDVSMIVGFNRDEATFFLATRGPLPKTVDEYRQSVRTQYGEAADRVLQLYPAQSDADVYWAVIALRTESGIGLSVRNQLRGMSTVTAKTWMYYFTHLMPGPNAETMGVTHAAELSYVFGTLPDREETRTARPVSDAMVRYWTQFAKTGDPNQSGLPQWPSFGKGHEAYLELGDAIKADTDLEKEKFDALGSRARSAETGFGAKKPILAAACKVCPWEALGEVIKQAVQSYGYDVQICYNCCARTIHASSRARACRLAWCFRRTYRHGKCRRRPADRSTLASPASRTCGMPTMALARFQRTDRGRIFV